VLLKVSGGTYPSSPELTLTRKLLLICCYFWSQSKR